MSDLREYFAGRSELVEFSPSASISGTVSPMSQPSVKAEALGRLWESLMLKLWALWSDILDTNDRIYDEAKPTLDELKGMQVEQSKSALSNFRVLARVLEKYQYVDKYTPQPQLKLFFTRMRYLVDELTYIAEQFDPPIPRPPEAPIQSREQWDKAQVQKRKDAKAADQGEAPDAGLPGQADIVFNPTQRKTSTTGTFTPGRTAGKDQAGSNAAGKTTARGKETKGGEKRPSKTQTSKPKSNEKSKNGKPTSAKPRSKAAETSRKGKAAAQPSARGSAASKKAPKTNPAKKPAKMQAKRPTKKLKEWEALESSVILSSLVEAADSPEPEAQFITVGRTIEAALSVCSDIFETRTEIGECTPGGLPRLDLFVEWFKGPRPSDCYGYARLWFNEDVGLYVLDACDRVRDVLRLDEEITDDHLANRIYRALDEVYDPSPTRIWEKERVVPALYRLIERVQSGETVHERAFAQTLDCLRGNLGLHERVRVPGTGIRLLARHQLSETDITSQRGQLNYHYSWAVQTPLTHQAVPKLDPFDGSMTDPVPGDEYADAGLMNKEPYISGSAIATGLDAEARAGVDRWPFATWQSRVQAVKEALAHVQELAKQHPNEYAYQASARQLEGRLQHLYDLPKTEASAHWRTPDIVIDLDEGCVYLESADRREKLEKDATDEDVTARIASMARQKESADGPVYEPLLNKPGSSLNEIYARCGLELEKHSATYYTVYWHGKCIGRVEKHENGLWSCHRDPEKPQVFDPNDRGTHLGPHPAAIALAQGQGLNEAELSQQAVVALTKLDDGQFDLFAEAVGLNPGEPRFANSVLYVRKLYELDFGGSWMDTYTRQLTNPDPAALTEALVHAVREEGMCLGAVEWADKHWREFL